MSLVVLGAGPAGLAASVTAADAGCDVTVLDSGRAPGGQYLRQRVTGPPDAPVAAPPHVRSRRAAALLARAQRHPRVTFVRERTVWHAAAPGAADPAGPLVLHTTDGEHTQELPAAALVVATGAHERVMPFPGWDLPGVLTAGAAQALLKGEGVLAGRRVLVAGTGPFLLAVAADLARGGAHVLAVVEEAATRGWARHVPAVAANAGKLAEGATYAAALRRLGVPVVTRAAVTRAEPDGDGLLVTVDRRDRAAGPGRTEHHRVDALCVGHGFTPSPEVAVSLGCAVAPSDGRGGIAVRVDAYQRTTVPGVLAAGEVTGVGGAELSVSEGVVAGYAAAVALGVLPERELERRTAAARRRRARERAFARALAAVYAPDDAAWIAGLDDDTVVCRCEEVTLGALREGVVHLGADDVRSVKLVTRAGMGLCQARVCGEPVARLLERLTGLPVDRAAFAGRPVAVPVPLGAVAAGPQPAPSPPAPPAPAPPEGHLP
jgi:NADPH-dependent 2,4-dienoyl-CoA reductase/sulfur reductase-like enzyme